MMHTLACKQDGSLLSRRAWVMSYAHIWNPVDRDVRQIAEMYSFILFFEVIEKKKC